MVLGGAPGEVLLNPPQAPSSPAGLSSPPPQEAGAAACPPALALPAEHEEDFAKENLTSRMLGRWRFCCHLF